MKSFLLAAMLLPACTTITYKETLPSGLVREISVSKPITDTSIDEFYLKEQKSGAKEVVLKGYTSEQTKALAEVVGAAVKASIEAVKP